MKFLFNQLSIGKKNRLDVAVLIWFLLAVLAALSEILRGPLSYNNYLLFKYVFFHSVEQSNLFLEYPSLYFDANHYGPSFSVFIAPFAILPDWLGCFLWCMVNAGILYYAIVKLNFSRVQCISVLLITAIEMMTSIHNVQFNPMLTAWILLAFILVEKEKEYAATFLIAAGFLVKLYGIVALASFFFSKHKMRFTLSFIGWMIALFCLPMVLSSPSFVVQSYVDWYHSLVEKDMKNAGLLAGGHMQDISVQGMVRRIFNNPSFSQLWVLAPAGIMTLLPLLRTKSYKAPMFKLLYAALVLIATVIFSSSAESATYVIAVTGVAIWFVVQPKPYKPWAIALLVLALVLTSLSATDLFPTYIKANIVRAYSLKALPCFLVWVVVWHQLMFSDFSKTTASPLAA